MDRKGALFVKTVAGTALTAAILISPAGSPIASAYKPQEFDGQSSPKAGYRPVSAASSLGLTEGRAVSLSISATTDYDGWRAVMSAVTVLRGLTDGWDGLSSFRPRADLLSWISQNASAISTTSDDMTVYPLHDGSIGLHWSRNKVEYTVELRPDELFLFTDNTVTDEYSSETRPLTAQNLSAFLLRGSKA